MLDMAGHIFLFAGWQWKLSYICQLGRIFMTLTRKMFGLRSLVKRFCVFGRAALMSLF